MGELEMRSLSVSIVITLLLLSCGKDRTREQIVSNIQTLEEAKAETTDEELKDTLESAIQRSKRELQHDTKIQREIKKYNQEHGNIKNDN